MNARSYRHAYEKPAVLEIQRQRVARKALSEVRRAAQRLAVQSYRSRQRVELLEQRTKPPKPVYVPIKPMPIHQVILSWPAPVLGSLAYGMAYAPRGSAA